MISRKNTLFDHGLNCITMLVLGISNAPFIPQSVRLRMVPFLLLILAVGALAGLIYFAKHGKQETKREQRDERSQMILERAVWYCHQAEDWLLMGLFIVFGMVLQRYEVAYTFFWVMIGRYILSFLIRWWLNRKY